MGINWDFRLKTLRRRERAQRSYRGKWCGSRTGLFPLLHPLVLFAPPFVSPLVSLTRCLSLFLPRLAWFLSVLRPLRVCLSLPCLLSLFATLCFCYRSWG